MTKKISKCSQTIQTTFSNLLGWIPEKKSIPNELYLVSRYEETLSAVGYPLCIKRENEWHFWSPNEPKLKWEPEIIFPLKGNVPDCPKTSV